jgi:hypothetical protein
MVIRDPHNPSTGAEVCPRKQTPTGDALQVQIGPGDTISNIPVVIDYEHHQIHEGESYLSFDEQLAIATATVKYSIDVPAGIEPHMIVSIDAYNGSAICRLWHTATYTGGTPLAKNNRNRNSSNVAAITIKTGVTSIDGTQFESLLGGTGKSGGGSNRNMSEFILHSGTTYRVDIEGLDAGVKVITRFYWYEDLGV